MGFVMESSCFLQSPLCHSQVFSSSFSSSQSALLYIRNAETKKRNSVPMASLRQEDPNDTVFMKRGAVLLVGISVLPFLQLKARALDGLRIGQITKKRSRLRTGEKLQRSMEIRPTDKSELTPKESQKAELPLKGDPPPNSFLSLLNGLGIFGAGLLGALYALAQKEKKSADETIESMKTKLKDDEAAFVSMEKNFDSRLLNEQEERIKQLKKAREEQLSLTKQLNSANITVMGLEQRLKNERRLCEELKVQIGSIQSILSKAGEDKKVLEEKLKEKLDSIEFLQERINLLSSELKDKEYNVRNLSSSLAEKELALKNLNSSYNRSKDELEEAHSEIGLKDELLKKQNELESKNSTVNELNVRINSTMVERNDYKRKLDDILKGYNDLKLSSEKQAAREVKLLEEREHEVHQLKEKLEHALNEVSRNEATMTDLAQERENLKRMLDTELTNVKNLKHEHHVTQETLGKSRNEASDLPKQLRQSRSSCAELESELSKLQAEFAEVRDTLQRSLDEAKQSGEVLASELIAAKELLKKTKDELQFVTHALAVSAENRDNLQKELVDAYKKAETMASDLKEEKKIVSSVNKELQTLQKQILKDKEARKSLETDVEEATKSLNEMNRNALTLSRELENANSLIYSLEDEKEVLYKSLTEHKNASKEARENIEDAHNLVVGLGKERDSLEKRAKKLEEELASAKGEILQLRSQINSSKLLVTDQHPQEDEAEEKVTVAAKKNGRKRKASSQ